MIVEGGGGMESEILGKWQMPCKLRGNWAHNSELESEISGKGGK